MKSFDYYGQMVLIISGLLMAIDYEGMGILFAGLTMLILGVWQLFSTIANLASTDEINKSFFRMNLFIASLYTVIAIVVFIGFNKSFSDSVIRIIMFIMLGIPPLLIFRYWIGISKIYNVGFFKKKTTHGQS